MEQIKKGIDLFKCIYYILLSVVSYNSCKKEGRFMSKINSGWVLVGVAIFLIGIYSNSFSQAPLAENRSLSFQVVSPTDTHCVAKPGDTNGDNKVSLADIFLFIPCIFKACPINCCPFKPECRGDANGDGLLSIRDIVYLINFIFKGGPEPVKSQECCL